jgi:hypothetical protein
LIIDGTSLKMIGERAFAFRGNGERDLVSLDVPGSIPYDNGVVKNGVLPLYNGGGGHNGYFGGKACLVGGRSWRSQEVALVKGTGTGQPKVVDMRPMGNAKVLEDPGWTGYMLEMDLLWTEVYSWLLDLDTEKRNSEIEDLNSTYSATRSNIDTKKYYGGRYGSTVKRMYLPAGLKSIMGLGIVGGFDHNTAAYGGAHWLDDGNGGGVAFASGHEGFGSLATNYGIPKWYTYGAADTMLEYVELPADLESIGTSAFGNCINVKFGVAGSPAGDWTGLEKLTRIDALAFLGCEDFTEVELPAGCIDFYNGNMGLQFAHSGLKKVTLAAGTKRISGRMFRGCKSLLKVNFNELALLGGGIQEYAFDGCEKLGSEPVDVGEDDTTLVYQRTWGTMNTREFAGTGYKRLEIAGGYLGGRTPIETGSNIDTDWKMPFNGCKKLKEVRLPKYWRMGGADAILNLGDFQWVGTNGYRFLNGVGTEATDKSVLMDSQDRSTGTNLVGGNYAAADYAVKDWYEVRFRLDLMGGRIPDKLVYGHGKGLLGDERLVVGIWDNWNEEWYNGPFDGDDHTGDHTAWTGLYAYGGIMSGAEGNGWNAGVLVSWVKKEDGEGNV